MAYYRRTAARRVQQAQYLGYDANYLGQKYKLPPVLVEKIIKQEGPDLANIERYLARMKANGR